jgi:hypothetical protein
VFAGIFQPRPALKERLTTGIISREIRYESASTREKWRRNVVKKRKLAASMKTSGISKSNK